MSGWDTPMTAGKGGGDFEKPPVGNHFAVLVGLIDLGTQWQTGYGGKPGKWERRIYFVWELVSEMKANGTPHYIGCDLNASFNEKANMRLWMEARRGVKFQDGQAYKLSDELKAELGQPCMLLVQNNDSGHPKVRGVAAIPKGMTAPPAAAPAIMVPFAPGPAPALPDWVPWLFGKTAAAVISGARENGGQAPGGQQATPPPAAQQSAYQQPQAAPTQAAPTQAAPANGPAAAPKGPPAGPPPNYLSELFWVYNQPAMAADKPHSRQDIATWLPASGLDERTVMLCKEGDNGWRPALEYGFTGTGF